MSTYPLFDDFWTAPRAAAWQPACDVEESEDHYLVTLEMPGVAKDQIKVEMVDHQLTISGERHPDHRERDGATWYTERRYGKFLRRFALPSGIDTSKIEANHQDGILRVYLPKAETARLRQIRIGAGPSPTGFFAKLLGQHAKEGDKAAS